MKMKKIMKIKNYRTTKRVFTKIIMAKIVKFDGFYLDFKIKYLIK